MARTLVPIRASTTLPPRPTTLAAYHAAVRPIRSKLRRLLRSRSHPAGRFTALVGAWELLGDWLGAAEHVAAARHLPARADLGRLRRRYATLQRDWLLLAGIEHAPVFAAYRPAAAAGYAAAWGQAEAMCRELDGLGYHRAPTPATRSNAAMHPPITLPLPTGTTTLAAGRRDIHVPSASAAEVEGALRVAGMNLHWAMVCGLLAHGLPDVEPERRAAHARAADAAVAVLHLARRAKALGLDWRAAIEGGVDQAGAVLALHWPTLDHRRARAGTMELLDGCLEAALPDAEAIMRAVAAKAPPAPVEA